MCRAIPKRATTGMGRHGTYMRVATRARETGPRAIEGPRARKCVLWHQANLNPPTEMTVRIRKMRACVSCVRVCVWCVVRVVRVVWSAAIRHGTSLVKRVRFYPTRSYRRHQLCTQVGRVCTSVQGRAAWRVAWRAGGWDGRVGWAR